MSFVSAIQSGFRNYVNFKGRATRSEHWWWALFTLIVQIVTSGMGDAIGGVVSLGILVPSIAVQVRRLHDTNRSGWWMLWPIASLGVAVATFVAFAVSTTLNVVSPSEWDPVTAFDGMSGVIVVLIAGSVILAFVFGIVNLVFTLQPSQVGENRFGPPPPPRSLS